MMRHLLTALAVLAVATALPADEKKAPAPTGIWIGKMKAGLIELTLAFDIAQKDDALSAKFYSLDQTKEAIPVKGVTFADGTLKVDIADVGANYEGKLNEKGDAISGEFKQSGVAFKLDLTRTDKLPVANRPQTPKGPFPYPTEEVTFENAAAKDLTAKDKDNPPNVKLAGTLTLPKGDGPFPAVVLVSGSGPQDRDETLFEHKPFLVLADHFARHGIACLRYDDRGVGKSTGTQANATSADFATDAHAAVLFLKAHKMIDGKRVGICGHSEGGLIAPMVAAAHPKDVAFIVLLAGPGVSGEKILTEQMFDGSMLQDPKADAKEVKEGIEVILKAMRSDKQGDEFRKELTAVLEAEAAKEKDEKKREEGKKALPAAIGRLCDPWLRWFVAFDPAPTLEKVTCPVLAVNGEKDVQVKAKDNLEAIESALTKGGNKQFKCVEFKGLNHLFQPCKTGQVGEYGQIEQTIAPEVLKTLTEWIHERK
jgi:pimeloyl-ACP methyl ester carboxylesterase